MTTETMTAAPTTTNDGAAASAPVTAPATGADGGGQQQPVTQAQPADSTAATQQPTTTATGQPVTGAPESYSFAETEGVTIDQAVIGAFADVAKELNLPQDKAQKVIDKVAPVIAQRQADLAQAQRTAWVETTKTDKEIGGDKLEENIAIARKGLDTFCSPELRTMLNDSGLGNHPEVIRAFWKVGKAISEDRLVTGTTGGPEQDASKTLFPNQA